MMKDDSFALDVYEGAPHTGKVSFDLPSTGLSSTFLWLWGGQTVSLVGSQISALSFQVVAVTVLHASPMQMGVVTASQTIPYLLFGLFVGVLVDRVSRRRLLIGADLARLGILFTAATLAASHHLGVPLLCAIVCAISTINLIFDAALGAYIPELLDRRQWLRANSRLSVSMSGSEVAGPGVAGYILQVLSAAGAMVTDAVSYLISAVCILCAKPAKQAVVKKSSQWDRETSWGLSSNVLHSVREGVGFVFTHPILRIFALWSAVWNFSWSAVLAVLVLYATQTLKLPPRSIGMVLAIGGIGGVAGAACASRLAGLLSQGRVLVFAPLVGACGGAILLGAQPVHAVLIVSLGLFLYNIGESAFGVNMQTCRQEVTPSSMMGRMDTTMRLCFRGMASVGALAGGYIASRFGIRSTLMCGVFGLFCTVLGLCYSRLSKLANS